MCRAVRCKTCGKTTWTGCGQHVNEVMARIPRADRCPGHPRTERTSRGFLAKRFNRG